MMTVTVAQIRTIAERADIEEVDDDFQLELDQPSRGDPGIWQHPTVVVRQPGSRLEGFMFAVAEDGHLLTEGP